MIIKWLRSPSMLQSHGSLCARRARSARRSVPAMASTKRDVCVSPQWLKSQLDAGSDVRVLDATWYMPNWNKSEVADFKAQRIPGARFFHIDGIAERTIALPHMLPKPEAFAAAMDALGISSTSSTVVLYDQVGIFSAPRAWWTFIAMGHDPSKVLILEGGLPAWNQLAFPIDQSGAADDDIMGPTNAAAAAAAGSAAGTAKYTASFQADKVRTLRDIQANIASKADTVVDARSGGRFRGIDPEPRPGLPSGHIPGSRSLPFTELLVEGKRFKPVAELRQLFEGAGVDPDAPVAVTCGSGLTACILAAGLYQVSGQLAALYDGAWTEWASTEGTPRATEGE